MFAAAVTENSLNGFAHNKVAESFMDEHSSVVDSDADSVAEDSASRESHSSGQMSHPIKKEVCLLELLSQKSSVAASEKINDHDAVLNSPPSTSASIVNSSSYQCSFECSNGTDSGNKKADSGSQVFVKERSSEGAACANQAEGSSPWMRNAGRKKSHPVWDFFKDLRAPDGSGGVICLHCSWKGDDRSPNNLKTHLKRFHEHDGVYQQFSAKLAATPTQPYVKRNRSMTYFPTPTSASDTYGSGSNANKCQPNNGLNAVRAALAQQQKSSEENKTMNFLAMIPRSSEIINITAGYSGEEESKAKSAEANGSERRSVDENGEAANNDSTNSLVQTRPSSHQAGGSPSVSSTNNQHQTAPFLSAAANNPFMYMAAAGAMAGSSGGSYPSGKISSTFSLMDGECVTTLMRVAADLDCTFLFHCRGGQPHFCFEPNVCAADKLRGPELSIVDLDHEIRVTERNGGVDVDSEMWKKTDWTQFTWAIRGKCQKALSRR